MKDSQRKAMWAKRTTLSENEISTLMGVLREVDVITKKQKGMFFGISRPSQDSLPKIQDKLRDMRFEFDNGRGFYGEEKHQNEYGHDNSRRYGGTATKE